MKRRIGEDYRVALSTHYDHHVPHSGGEPCGRQIVQGNVLPPARGAAGRFLAGQPAVRGVPKDAPISRRDAIGVYCPLAHLLDVIRQAHK